MVEDAAPGHALHLELDPAGTFPCGALLSESLPPAAQRNHELMRGVADSVCACCRGTCSVRGHNMDSVQSGAVRNRFAQIAARVSRAGLAGAYCRTCCYRSAATGGGAAGMASSCGQPGADLRLCVAYEMAADDSNDRSRGTPLDGARCLRRCGSIKRDSRLAARAPGIYRARLVRGCHRSAGTWKQPAACGTQTFVPSPGVPCSLRLDRTRFGFFCQISTCSSLAHLRGSNSCRGRRD